MKRLFLLIAAISCGVFATVGCDDDDNNGKLDKEAKIWINGVNTTNKYLQENPDGSQRRLTVEEICKGDSVTIAVRSYEGAVTGMACVINPIEDKPAWGGIDTIQMRLSLQAGNIQVLEDNAFLSPDWYVYIQKMERYTEIVDNGKLYVGWVYTDTIAYVPRAQRLEAYEKLVPLFEDKDANWSEIYRIFNEAYIFVPCTGEEYKKLRESGEE